MIPPKMPEEYRGAMIKNGGYTKTNPREWTQEEIIWCENLRDRGYSTSEIALSVGRTKTSVATKIKRLSKRDETYNDAHRLEKYALNSEFVKYVNPKTVLDCYCGNKRFYATCSEAISNDIDETIPADHHLDAFKLLCMLYQQGKSFDLIDLDPYGSAYDCFDLAVKMARKAIVITFGELGHKRFKRLDFVGSHYGIETIEQFTLDTLIKHVQMIGRRNKKSLIVWQKREWHNIGRVWLIIEPLKVTSQWEPKPSRQEILFEVE